MIALRRPLLCALLCLAYPVPAAEDGSAAVEDPRDARIRQLTARVERLEKLVGRDPGSVPPAFLAPAPSLESRVDHLERDVQALHRRSDPGPGQQDQTLRDVLRSLRELQLDLRTLHARVDRLERGNAGTDSLHQIRSDMDRLRRELDRVRAQARDNR